MQLGTKRPLKAIIFSTFSILSCIFFLASCSFWNPEITSYGIQPQFEDYVPARIAILPCQLWPKNSHLKNQIHTNVSTDITNTMCHEFESFILKSFRNQPYMNGFSPERVEELLRQNKASDHLKQLTNLWSSDSLEEDSPFTLATSFYTKKIQDLPEWRRWLLALSNHAKQSDAILLPMIQYASENKFDDRGLLVAQRSSNLILFLIDTNSGKLLWAGHRQGAKTNSTFVDNKAKLADLIYPDWDLIYSQLFVEDFWREFPGRLIY